MTPTAEQLRRTIEQLSNDEIEKIIRQADQREVFILGGVLGLLAALL